MIPFDPGFSAGQRREFVEDILVGDARREEGRDRRDFRFGNGAKGDPGLLAADPRFADRRPPAPGDRGRDRLSSQIRGLVLAGGKWAAGTSLLGSRSRSAAGPR